MRPGAAAERARVIALIEEGSQPENRCAAPSTAAAVLDHLEANGFRVAPAGLVADLDALLHTEEVLENAGDVVRLDVPQLTARLEEAAATVRIARELGVTMLGLAPDEDGTGAQLEPSASDDPWAADRDAS